jgi:4-amino-4-deoxy-L-arabinose transferase-like glycosyltransferase
VGWASLKVFARSNRQALWFPLGWYTMVFLIFSFGSLVRTRYLLPTYPCIAVACGALLDHLARQPRPAAWLQRFVVILLSLGIVVGAVSVIGWRLDWRAGAGGLFMAMAAAVLLRLCRRTEPLFALGSFLIVAFSAVMLTWRPLFAINPADALARQLSEPQFAGRPLAALGIPPVISSQLRLVSGGKLNPREVSSPGDLNANAVVLVGESWRQQVAAAGYKLAVAPFRTKHARLKDIVQAWRTGHREDSFESSRQDYYIGVQP